MDKLLTIKSFTKTVTVIIIYIRYRKSYLIDKYKINRELYE